MLTQTKSDVVATFRRVQILEAARRSFARHGLNATTVDHIAKAAKLAKGTVYLYYRSKDEILCHALEEELDALERETVPVIAAAAHFEDKLRQFLGGMLGYYDRNREFVELCQLELGADMRRQVRAKFGRIYAAQARAWQAAISRGVREGRLARVNARHAALAIVSLGHGLAIQRSRGWTDVPLDDDIAHATALLWKGLAVR